MARNRHKADDETRCWEVHCIFYNQADAEEFLKSYAGVADSARLTDRKEIVISKTILGRLIMDIFDVPNRTYDIETIEAIITEARYARSSARTYISGLVAEGLLYKCGTSWARKYRAEDDATPAVRPDIDLATASNGHLAGLEFGQACQCGCGDEG